MPSPLDATPGPVKPPKPAAPAPQPPMRRFGDYDATRQAVFSNALEAARNIPPVENSRYTLSVHDVGFQGPDRATYADHKRALYEGRTLGRRLTGTLRLTDKASGAVTDARRLTLASVPILTQQGVFVLDGNASPLCLYQHSRVWTESGMLKIRDIVDNKLEVRVWSYDFGREEFVLRRVVGWHKNLLREKIGTVKRPGIGMTNCRLDNFKCTTLHATAGHEVYRRDGTKCQLGEADSLTVLRERLSPAQVQAVYGSLLGDANITDGVYTESHAKAQSGWLDAKRKILGDLVPAQWPALRPYVNNSTGRDYVKVTSRRHAEFLDAEALCYPDGKKRISRAWLSKLDAAGLAFWFGDDGSCWRRTDNNSIQVLLSTQGFSTACIDLLIEWLLRKWSISGRKSRIGRYQGTDHGWEIRISGRDADNFLDLVAPYLTDDLRYKLPTPPVVGSCLLCASEVVKARKYCDRCALKLFVSGEERSHARARFGGTTAVRHILATGELPDEYRPAAQWRMRAAAIGSGLSTLFADNQTALTLDTVDFSYEFGVNCLVDAERYGYDIEVEGTHNYFADGVLVSNSHQARLASGVYIRRKANSDIEAHVPFLPGEGVPHRFFLDPESGHIKTHVGQAELPAYTLMKALGATDEEISNAWGPGVAAVNAKIDKPHHLEKYWDRMGPGGKNRPDDLAAGLRQHLETFKFDPWVTARTLGAPLDRYGKEAALRATSKLIKVFKGQAQPDDRDNPAYAVVWGPEHLIAERIARSRPLLTKALWQATNKGNLKGVQPGMLTAGIRALFSKSGLGQSIEGTNSAEFVDHGARITKIGEGGIGRSADAVPASCYTADTEVFTRGGWVKWPDVNDDTELACRIDGVMEFHRPLRIIAAPYTGLMYGYAGYNLEYLVTPNHAMWVQRYRGGSSLKRCGPAPWIFEAAAETHRKPRRFQCGHGAYRGGDRTRYTVPGIADKDGYKYDLEFDTDDWAEFVGWYVAEGSVVGTGAQCKPSQESLVYISQSRKVNPEKCSRISRLLSRMGLRFTYPPSSHSFLIRDLRIRRHLSACGYRAVDKKLPQESFEWPVSARRRLYDALVAGDGSINATGNQIYTSTSRALIEDFSRLAVGLGLVLRGRTTRVYTADDNSRGYTGKSWADSYSTVIATRSVIGASGTREYDNYYTQAYDGTVYCAEVPGNLLYVRRGGGRGFWCGNSRDVNPGQFLFVDPIRASESENVGVDLRVAFGTRLGADRQLYAPLLDPKTDRIVYRSPRDLADATVAFPGWKTATTPLVPAVSKGKMTWVRRDQIDYAAPSMEQSFSPLTNLVPLKSASKPHRASMGGRYIVQALPLAVPEAPLVRTQVPNQPGKSFEELFGRHMGAVLSDKPGVVTEVTPDNIKIRHPDGTETGHELYNWLPSGRKTGNHNYPLVRVGQQVQPGHVLARSEFTDDQGHAAYGANLRTAFASMGGKVYEDSILASQSAAKRLSSSHLYRHHLPLDEHTKTDVAAYLSAFPGKYPLASFKNFDPDGVIKPGTRVESGQPLILGVRKKLGEFGRLSRSGKAGLTDASQVWDHDEPGVVTDVARTPEGFSVSVHTVKQLKDGDKVSGRHGNKGVVVILPDHKMPTDAQGRPVDVVLSSLATISRANPSAIFEAHLGKIAAKTGKPYVVDDFHDHQHVADFVDQEAKKHGVPFSETLTDPETGRAIPNVGVGNLYLMKLLHVAESKSKGRGLGGYDESGQPLRGQSGKAMRASLGDTHALLSHGASSVLRDLHMYKGQANDVFWQAYMSGFPPPRPSSSKAFDRFLAELRASGVHPVRRNDRIHLTALRDADVHELAGDREVKNSETLDFNRNGAPVAGGLFDEALTGGPEGTAWSKISLHEPVPNPVAEDPVRRLLGLTRTKFRDVMAGREKLNDQTGPTALLSALKKFDVEAELRRTEEVARSGRKTARDDANRKLGYLRHMAATGRTPADWFLSAVPVLPPVFRPIRTSSFGGRDNVIISDPNLLYKDVMEANKALKMLSGQVGDVGDERLALYDSVKAVMGLGEPVSAKNKERGVKGVLEKLLGTSAKHGYLQQKLLGTPADLSGRGQILPDPDLDMDQIGIPESVAWEVYHPFIVRRMVQSGMSRAEAARVVEARADVARKAMVDEMEARPVQATRYPALHRYSVMAFRPRLTAGDAIRITPIVTKGYGADFNGDSCLTPLLSVQVGGKLFLGSFEQFIARYVSPDYQEDQAVRHFGKQTTVFAFSPEADVRVPSVDAGGVFAWRSVAEISIHTSHGPDCFQVRTETGLNAVFTAHHNFLQLDDRCQLVAVKTTGVQPGTLVPHVVGVDLFDPVGSVPPGLPDLPLTFETGLWLGHYLGDGSITGRDDTVSHASTDAKTLDLLERIGPAFSAKRPWREGNGYSSRWSDRDLVKLLTSWVGRGAAGKRVAGWMVAAPVAFRKGLIAGYLMAEGSVRRSVTEGGRTSTVTVECISRPLLLDFKLILSTLGVVARIREGKKAYGNNQATWVMAFGVRALARLALPFPDTAKSTRFVDIKVPEKARDGHWDVVPFPPSVFAAVQARGKDLRGGAGKALRQALGSRPKPMTHHSMMAYGKRGSISRYYAELLVASLGLDRLDNPAVRNWIAVVRNKNLVWDTVTAVEKVDRPDVTYDFHVPGAETFCVDGFFLTHNTMTLHVPLTDEAVKEAYEKMLPSKNLYSTSDFKPKNYLPNMEFVQGLHYASTANADNVPVQFRTRAEALKALRSGQIGLDTQVHIAED